LGNKYDPAGKIYGLKNIIDHILPGRWNDVRRPTEKELNATSVFSINIEDASAKIRTGDVIDEEEDMNLNVWAGILPLKIIAGEPIKDSNLSESIPLPEYLSNY
jgi:uncharacterized protein